MRIAHLGMYNNQSGNGGQSWDGTIIIMAKIVIG